MLLVRIQLRAGVQHYMIKFVGDLWKVSGFLLFPPRYNWNIVESGIKHHKTIKKSNFNTIQLLVSSIHKTDVHNINEILLKKVLNIHKQNILHVMKITKAVPKYKFIFCCCNKFSLKTILLLPLKCTAAATASSHWINGYL
jgi:hypothetical protein